MVVRAKRAALKTYRITTEYACPKVVTRCMCRNRSGGLRKTKRITIDIICAYVYARVPPLVILTKTFCQHVENDNMIGESMLVSYPIHHRYSFWKASARCPTIFVFGNSFCQSGCLHSSVKIGFPQEWYKGIQITSFIIIIIISLLSCFTCSKQWLINVITEW